VPPYVASGIAALPLAMWLGRNFGAVGAATAQLLVYVGLACALYWTSQRLFRVIVRWRRVALHSALIVLAASVASYLTSRLGSTAKVADLALFIVLLTPLWATAWQKWLPRLR
jgi:hypothetical protein